MELLSGQLNNLIASLAVPCELAHYSIVITGVKRSWGMFEFFFIIFIN